MRLASLPHEVLKRVALPTCADDGKTAAALKMTCRHFELLTPRYFGVPCGALCTATGHYVFPPASAFGIGQLISEMLHKGRNIVFISLIEETEGLCLLTLRPGEADPFVSSLTVERLAKENVFNVIVRISCKELLKSRQLEDMLIPLLQSEVCILPGLQSRTPVQAGHFLVNLIGGGSPALDQEWSVSCLLILMGWKWYVIPAPTHLSDSAQYKYLRDLAELGCELTLHSRALHVSKLCDLESISVQMTFLGTPGRAHSFVLCEFFFDAELDIRSPCGTTMILKSPPYC
jgi:hypothetical protein